MLTEKIIRDLKPDTRTTIVRDHKQRGLGVRITPKGTKAYVLEYWTQGRRRMATLGRCTEMSLQSARKRAAHWMVRIQEGRADPLGMREKARADAAMQPTVNEAIDRFFDEYVPGRLRAGRLAASTVAMYRMQCNAPLRPAIGHMKVADVTRGDIERAVAPYPPVSRNRLLALASRLFNLFEYWEIRPQHSNPTRGIERFREEPRDRVLSADELAALGQVLGERVNEHPHLVGVIRFTALTGLRIGEVLAIRWQDVHPDQHALLLPKTKTGRRSQTLSTAALEVLTGTPRLHGCEHVFSLTGKAAITYKTARQFFADCLEEAGLKDIHLHDLRRTVMTNAAIDGVGAHVLRDMLGHRTTAVADRYIRRTGSALVEATERSGSTMAAMLAGSDSANVVPLRRRSP